MNRKYQAIWNSAVIFLEKGIKKDYVLHTSGVVKAMELLLEKENGNPGILIPAAILHDVGWASVPRKYQQSANPADQLRGKKLHIESAPEIITKILQEAKYKDSQIKEIIGIVQAHRFSRPRKLTKRLLVDADQLSDAFKEQFYSDAKAYKQTPRNLYAFRMKNNTFYTEAAKRIFLKEMDQRRKESLEG